MLCVVLCCVPLFCLFLQEQVGPLKVRAIVGQSWRQKCGLDRRSRWLADHVSCRVRGRGMEVKSTLGAGGWFKNMLGASSGARPSPVLGLCSIQHSS